MKTAHRQPFFGRRLIKTGISVFITALICLYLHLPPEFAVIAAIVTIEPTASASIKKGLIRLPASAIGAAFAVLFVYLMGESSLSYALAAILTIFCCRKLKLDDGILVATLTAVAMIPDINGNLFLAFLSRLGTTFIGLTVSSLVNFFILPPKFNSLIEGNLYPNFELASEVLEESITKIISLQDMEKPNPSPNYTKLRQSTEKISAIASFQEKEWKYHKIKLSEYRHFDKLRYMNTIMQRIVLHLGNLQYISEPALFSGTEKKLLERLAATTKQILCDPIHRIPDYHYNLVNELDQHLKYESTKLMKVESYFHHFTTKTIVFYELLSLHDSLEELEQMTKCEEYIE